MSIITRYIESRPKEHQAALTTIYQWLQNELPEATEKLAYGMPTFYQGKNLLHFADNQKHLGFYPTPAAITAFSQELTPYKTSKGAIQFPYDQLLPQDLIVAIARFQKENVLGK